VEVEGKTMRQNVSAVVVARGCPQRLIRTRLGSEPIVSVSSASLAASRWNDNDTIGAQLGIWSAEFDAPNDILDMALYGGYVGFISL
jgi:hypothetical protein